MLTVRTSAVGNASSTRTSPGGALTADVSFPVEIRPPSSPAHLQSNGREPPRFTWRCLPACGFDPVETSDGRVTALLARGENLS